MKWSRMLLVLPVVAMLGCAGMAARSAARTQRAAAARQAAYDVTRSEMVKAMLGVVTQNYALAVYAEDRGLFESEWATQNRGGMQFQVKISGQIIGNGPYRVDFRATVRQQDSSGNWSIGEGKPYEDELYSALYDELRDHVVAQSPS